MKYALVQTPSTFPASSRPIFISPVADVTYKEKSTAYPKLAQALNNIAESHSSEKILVHTVSYDLTRYLSDNLPCKDRIISYGDSASRQRAIDSYICSENGILLASSLDRGIDLPGNDCRAIVVCKVPYPSLGDKQVSARLHTTRDGQLWYSVQTVRTLVQMTGRGMRSIDDFCESYILDRQFVSRIYKQHRGLLPEWWKEALRFNERRF